MGTSENLIRSKTEKDVDLEQNGPLSSEKSNESIPVKSAEGVQATAVEILALVHVVEDIPVGVWLAAFVGSAERFTWFGATGPLRRPICPRRMGDW